MGRTLLEKLMLKKVTGEVITKNLSHIMLRGHPVTLYDILDNYKNVYHGAIYGHQENPNRGDKVEVYLVRGSLLAIESPLENELDGRSRLHMPLSKRKRWQEIKSYRILESKKR